MATAVNLDLPDELVEALDREIASGSYGTRHELIRSAIEQWLERQRIEPATEWGGQAGLHLLGEAAKRLPYESEGSSSR